MFTEVQRAGMQPINRNIGSSRGGRLRLKKKAVMVDVWCVLLLFVALNGVVMQTINAQCACNTTTVWNALKSLYDSTDGPRWANQTGWLVPGSTVCTWYGFINCNETLLSNNNLRGTLPTELSTLGTNLVAIDLSSNFISGTLPPEYASWTSLMQFQLNNNSLSGSLPHAYSAWTNLTLFYIGGNQLEGILPPEYNVWTSIQVFQVDRNRLTGTLPPEYHHWTTTLRMFRVDRNQLTGTLPPEFSSLTQMNIFSVSANHLTGTLPKEYSAWQYGGLLVFDSNELSGTIPDTWTGSSIGMLLVHNNRNLGGTIPPMMSLPAYVSMCNTSICGSIPFTWYLASTVFASQWICQNATIDDFIAYAQGDTTALHNITPALPPCTASPPTTVVPASTTTQSPAVPGKPPTTNSSSTAAQHFPVSLTTTTSGVTTAALGANAASAVVVAALGTVGGGAGAAMGAFVQSSGLSARVSARLRDCGAPSSSPTDNDAAANDEVGLFVGDNPTTIALPGRLSSSGGTVVGNALLLFAAPPVAAALYYAVRKATGAARNSDEGADDTQTKPVRLAVRLHLVVYAWVLVPTAAAAAVLLADGAHGGGGGPVVLGVLGLVVAAAPTAGIAVEYAQSVPLKGKRVSQQEQQPEAVSPSSSPRLGCGALAQRLCAERGSWALQQALRRRMALPRGVVPHLLLLHALSETLFGCVYPHGHVFLVDFALAAAQGLLAGSALSPSAAPSCAAVRGLLWSIFAVSVCAAGFEAWVRPRSALLDECVALLMAVWTALVALLSALDLEDAASGAAAAQAAVSLCCVVLQLVSGYLWRMRIPERRDLAQVFGTPRTRAPGSRWPRSHVLGSPSLGADDVDALRHRAPADVLQLLVRTICASYRSSAPPALESDKVPEPSGFLPLYRPAPQRSRSGLRR